jgi:hypothetical protein
VSAPPSFQRRPKPDVQPGNAMPKFAPTGLPVQPSGSEMLWVALLTEVQTQAAGALRNLAAGSEPNKKAIAGVPGSLQSLVTYLSSDSMSVQENAAAALRNLAGSDSNKTAIVAVPMSLENLVALLNSKNTGVQTQAAGALLHLAMRKPKAIIAVPGNLGRRKRRERFKTLAGNEPNKKAIGAVPGSLHGLLQSENLGVQENAAAALRNLAESDSNETAIVAVPGSLENLVALSSSGNTWVQTQAAGALRNLAAGSEPNKKAIAGVPGSLRSLVTFLSSVSTSVQENAAATLRNLAGSD